MLEVHIGHAILEKFATKCQSIGYPIVCIADQNVADLHGQHVLNLLAKHNLSAELLTFPAGEQSKTRETKAHLEDILFAKKYNRQTLLIGLGGGVTTDLVGYLAATFCRGVPYISLPTSLLAMVDASLGGKTAVNVPAGKNLIGALYHPQGVYMELDFLHTLPESEKRQGLVEMIKHALILDASYFDFLASQAPHCADIAQMIQRSCQIKQQVVQKDENEQGFRRLLNFGHTIGHALEAASGYTLPHGDAVALGMLVEAELAIETGILPASIINQIKSLYELYEIDPKIKFSITPQQLYAWMQMDKKAENQLPRFVLLKQIGEAESFGGQYCTTIDPEILFKVLERMCVCYAW